jgi:putative ABC transport system permease protein
MWRLCLNGLVRQRLRVALVAGALAIPVALFVCLSSIAANYELSLRAELDGMGVQMMLVPLGCPYDGAARVIKGQALDNTLPFSALEVARKDPDVEIAAPLLIASIPRPAEKRVDMWVGLDEKSRALKPWWKASAGADWFGSSNSVILGADAALVEMRAPGDSLYSPEANRSLRVDGVLARGGSADDNLFFVPLATAQEMFGQNGRLTAIAIRLRDPERIGEASKRLQEIPGAQVVTLTEMMGVFLNLVGSVRILTHSITLLGVVICLLAILNTMLAAVLQRSGELAIMRAIGASRAQIFGLVTLESFLISALACAIGMIAAVLLGRYLVGLVGPLLPLSPPTIPWSVSGSAIFWGIGISIGAGVAASVYPAWRASRIQPAIFLKSA